jgi:Carboxypeptidase regulatory-like domain/TonB dependent receptor-like, beta-barrel
MGLTWKRQKSSIHRYEVTSEDRRKPIGKGVLLDSRTRGQRANASGSLWAVCADVLSCRRLLLRCCVAAIALLLCAGPAAAQLLQGTIVGNVVDTSKAAIPNATVTAENLSTHFTRTTTTNSAGQYTFPDLPPGTYAVTIGARGFQSYKRTGIVLTVQTAVRVDATLAVGQTKQTVTVTATPQALQTERADVHTNLSGNLLANVPVPLSRNYQQIFITLPGSTPPQTGHSFSANPSRALTFNVNGGDVEASQTFVDGAGTRDFNAADVIQYIPSLDSIANVSAVTSTMEGDQSAGGAFINVTIKSGTNDVHGNLFEDFTQQGLQAYAWGTNHARPKAPFIDNQFGGTIGGPIKKNKLFYFVSYQGERLAEGNTVLASVPTAAMKAGDLSASPTPIYNPLTGNPDGSGRTPFPDNIIPASMIDPGIQKMLATGDWPNPNSPGTGAFGIGNDFLCTGCQGNSDTRRDQVDAKFNWDPTSKLSMFVRFGMFNDYWHNPQIFGPLGASGVSPDNGAVGVGAGTTWNESGSITYVFTPTLLVDGFFGYDRNDAYVNQPYNNENLGWTLLGIPGLDTAGLPPNLQRERNGFPALTLSGFTSLGPVDNYIPYAVANPEYNFNANINWIKGAHSIRAGISGDFQNSNEMQYETAVSGALLNPGQFEFEDGTTQLLGGPPGNDLNSLASMLLGLPQNEGSVYQFVPYYYTRDKNYGIYLMDTWQVTPKLTLTPGIRWDYFGFPTRLGTGMEFYDIPSSEMLICGKTDVPYNCGITHDRMHFDPTIGLAYRLRKSTVIRAGYSKAVDPILWWGHLNSDRQNYPYIVSTIFVPPNSFSYTASLRQGITVPAAPDIASGVVPAGPSEGLNTFNNANYVRGYSQTWNFTVEQRFANWFASVGYVGMRQIDPVNNLQLNWSPIDGGSAGEQLHKYNDRTASTGFLGSLGTNAYDGLQTSLRRQFRSGYELITNFTWSKALGYANAPYVNIPQYYTMDYGPQSFNFPYVFSMTGIAPLPFGAGRRWARTGLASKLAGGWQLSGIFSDHSGYPFTATANGSTLNSPFSGQFADCISPAQQTGDHMEVYNKSAFASPASGLGTCGTNSLMGPSDIDLDLDLGREIRLTERLHLKFDADMFNALNRPNFAVPSNSVNSSTFMEDTSLINGTMALDQRVVRFDLELDW